MMEAILNIQNLYKHYQGLVAVDHVNLFLTKGTINAIYGDNGAGKTTLFNLISGFEKPDEGKIVFNGLNITHKSVLYRARLGIGRLFQIPRIFSDISVLDNLLSAGNNHEARYLHNYLFKYSTIQENKHRDMQKAYQILEQLNLSSKAGIKAFELSVGEKRLLSLGSLLMNDAQLLLLDEPFAGINNLVAEQIMSILTQKRAKGVTFLIIEHQKDSLLTIADHVFEMKQGKLLNSTEAKHAKP